VKALLVISDRDNVGTALESLHAGRTVPVGDAAITVRQDIPRGHKVAIKAIAAGEPVVKYGSAIGIATAEIAAGAHVHTHNVASSRGRGDLGQRGTASEARLAEPPDEAGTMPDPREAAEKKGV
jgi:altronate dehydratase